MTTKEIQAAKAALTSITAQAYRVALFLEEENPAACKKLRAFGHQVKIVAESLRPTSKGIHRLSSDDLAPLVWPALKSGSISYSRAAELLGCSVRDLIREVKREESGDE